MDAMRRIGSCPALWDNKTGQLKPCSCRGLATVPRLALCETYWTNSSATRQPMGMEMLIPVLSLVVAALAVFFGPIISLHIARRQVTSSLEVANKQITAPMRQAWINSLRDLLAELTSIGVVAVAEDKTHAASRLDRMTHLQYKVLLMLNPKEQDHQKLEQLIKQMIAMAHAFSEEIHLAATQREVVDLSRLVLKREWDRVKEPIVLAKP